MRQQLSTEAKDAVKANLVKKFTKEIPTSNVTRNSIDLLAVNMMRNIETTNSQVVGSDKNSIVFSALNELLDMVLEIPTISAGEVEIVNMYKENKEIFDSLAYVFKQGFKTIVEVVQGKKKGFGCCSG